MVAVTSPAGMSCFAYVANGIGNSVAVIDTATKVIARFPRAARLAHQSQHQLETVTFRGDTPLLEKPEERGEDQAGLIERCRQRIKGRVSADV